MKMFEYKWVDFVLFMKGQKKYFTAGNIWHDGKHHTALLLSYILLCLLQRNLADSF